MKHLNLYESLTSDNSLVVAFVNGNQLGVVLLPKEEAHDLHDILSAMSTKDLNMVRIIDIPNSNDDLYAKANVDGTDLRLVDKERYRKMIEDGDYYTNRVGGFIYCQDRYNNGCYFLDLHYWTDFGYRGKNFILIDPWDNIKTLEATDIIKVFEIKVIESIVGHNNYL